MNANTQVFQVLSKEELLARIDVRKKTKQIDTHNNPTDESEISEKDFISNNIPLDSKSNLKEANLLRKRSQTEFLDLLERRSAKKKKIREIDDHTEVQNFDTLDGDHHICEENTNDQIGKPDLCEEKVSLKAPLTSLMQEIIPVPPTLPNPPETTSLPLPRFIHSALARNSINLLFPIQSYLLPSLLTSQAPLFFTASSPVPSDICVSAPTGSGKTLCYLLPILSRLRSRVVPRLRAVIVLPTKDLANQVHSVFVEYTRKTDLKVIILNRDTHTLLADSAPDILVSTPGRLVDSLNSESSFSLEYLEFLVVDEADRLLDQSYHEWIPYIISRIPSYPRSRLHSNMTLSVHCRKLLFSATLTRNPERLSQLDLYRPVLYCVENTDTQRHKYTLPPNLHQTIVTCSSTQDKPLLLYHILTQKSFSSTLCFTNSKDNTRRLFLFLSKLGFCVNEFSSLLSEKQRKTIFHKFSANEIDILICTDTMARGIDIQSVSNVINYDCPPFLKNYVHRVGRTARALQEGNAYTLLEKCEVYHFKKMMKEVSCEYEWKRVSSRILNPYRDTCSNALEEMQTELQDS